MLGCRSMREAWTIAGWTLGWTTTLAQAIAATPLDAGRSDGAVGVDPPGDEGGCAVSAGMNTVPRGTVLILLCLGVLVGRRRH